MSRYTDAERERIVLESFEAIERADAALADREPRDALAEPLAQPVEDKLTKWRREHDEMEAERRLERRNARATQLARETTPAPAPAIDWSARINAAVAEAVAAEREFQHELLAHTIARMQRDQADAIAKLGAEVRADARNDLRDLRGSLSELKLTLAELRLAQANDRSKVLDLPPLPRRTAELN